MQRKPSDGTSPGVLATPGVLAAPVFLAVCVLAAVVAMGCTMPYNDRSDDGSDGNVPTTTTPFIRQLDGTTVFSTNDTRYLGVSGTTLWRVGTLVQEVMTTFSANVYKNSGNAAGGYGLIFCVQSGGVSFYAALITTNGNYALLKVVNKTWSYLLPEGWKESDKLKKGYGSTNTNALSITRNGTQFDLRINGDAVDSFIDSSWAGGSLGFASVVVTADNFPDVPVQCVFRETSPDNILLPETLSKVGYF